MMEVLNTVVKIINFIRSRALNHRLFQALAAEMGADHVALLYHTNVRWLSRGRALERVFELRKEIEEFLRDRKGGTELHDKFLAKDFVLILAYLSDVFSHLNKSNLSLQGYDITVADAQDKIIGLKMKLELWKRRILVRNFGSFPLLDQEVENGRKIQDELIHKMANHLQVVYSASLY